MRVVAPFLAAAMLAACDVDSRQPAGAVATASVAARAETQPVGTANEDAADDSAIWRNAADPAASLIVATDKKSGLHVYGLDGRPRHFIAAGKVNNVDLVDLGAQGVIVAASDRNDLRRAQIQLYRLDTASGRLAPLGAVSGGAGEAYGLCLGRVGGQLHAFSALKEGPVHQVALDLAGPRPAGRIVRSLRLASQPEGCVVDERTGKLYVGEEMKGVWRFDAGPAAPQSSELVAVADGRTLVADVEGITLAPSGGSGGYLVISSQGDNAYTLYSLADMKPAGRFRIAAGEVGGTEETDGIALVLGDFGTRFPGGLFVAQDGDNAPHAQNFKLVAWDDVVKALRLPQ